MKNKFIIVLIMLLAMPAAFVGCSNGNAVAEKQKPTATYLGGENTIAEVTQKLKESGLSNTDEFRDWTIDFAKTAGVKAELKDAWIPLDKLNFDLGRTMDGWEEAHSYSDADCRMTAFLLLDGILKSKKVEQSYTGDYLMFDMQAIDSTLRYKTLKKKKQLFTTVFGDKVIEDGENPQSKFGEIWNEYGIYVDSDKVSLISIVIYDPDFKKTFVGHTGVMIKDKDGLVFVEKIAFEQPYQVTRVRTVDEIFDMFLQRSEYFGEKDEPGPYVYVNGQFSKELQ
ncbi:MAG: DUF4300 family protein [Eubacteriales bacterium]